MTPVGPSGRSPEAAHVYRVRRAAAATALVLVVFAVLRLVGVTGGGSTQTAVTTTTASSTTTLPPTPACTTGDTLSLEDPKDDWATILVDTERSLPPGYGPTDLRNISDAGFPFTPGAALRGFVMDDLRAMREAAIANGTPIGIIAAFRSHAQQVDLFARRVDSMGSSEAGSRVARPGHSEHQLGTTIDVTTEGATDVDQSWAASPTGQWVASHAHKYGFIISYPARAERRTCYDFEPWHLRYVGREMAAKVIGSGLTLREYLHAFVPPASAPPSSTTTTAAATTTTTTTG